MNKQVSDYGKSFIKRYEGLRTTIYKDSAGLDTIGYGHLITKAEKLQGSFKQGITERQANNLFDDDIELVRINLNRLLSDHGIATVTQGQFDALASFAFNLGIGKLEESTLLKYFKAGKVNDAADQFLRWVYAGKQKIKGLQIRRAAERELFLS